MVKLIGSVSTHPTVSDVGYEQGIVTNPQRLQPPPLLNSQFLGQSSYSPDNMYAVNRLFLFVFYQKCDVLSTYQDTKQPKVFREDLVVTDRQHLP